MYRIDNATAITPIPAPAAVGPNPNYFFTKGNPGTGTPATIVDDDWLNAVQEELCAVLASAGIAPDKTVRTQLLASIQKLGRAKLTGATSFYVRADGNDANTGTANTAGGAWLTLQHAITAVLLTYDFAGFQATINIGAGTFAGANIYGQATGQAGIPLVISGNGAGSTIISSTMNAGYGAFCLVQNMTIGSAAGNAVTASELGRVTIGAGVILSGATGGSLLFAQLCGLIQISNNLTISGGGANGFNAQTNGSIFSNAVTVTMTGTPAYSGSFANAGICGSLNVGSLVFAGSATGPRYSAVVNGAIFTNAGGANFFPGNSAGSTSTGGQYV